ncbi:MAG: flagellar motor switch protein FliG [Myxococcales bacterium]|nr:flagellar motor switch protein FliG [Myxococcales bacterium]
MATAAEAANFQLVPSHMAAILLVHLDEDTAVDVFRSLSRKEIKTIAKAAREMRHATIEQCDEVLAQYAKELGAGTAQLQDGGGYITRLAEKALGAEAAKAILEEDASALRDVLERAEPRMIAGLLSKEHPQTITVVVAHMATAKAASVVQALPDEVRGNVIQRLATIDTVTPEVTNLLEEALISQIRFTESGGASRQLGGIKLVADIMNNMEKSQEESLMTQLEESDEELADEIRALMFVFDDLINLEDRGVQALLKEVDRETLMLALKAADENIRQHIFKNLSARAVEMILDDMEAKGPVRVREVESAQAEIVRVALRLSQAGVIDLSTSGDDEFV